MREDPPTPDESLVEQKPVKRSFCGSLRRDSHWKCLFLSLLVLGCLTAIIWCRLTGAGQLEGPYFDLYESQTTGPCQDGYVYIPVAFVVMLYLVYLVECWHCHTHIQLQYKTDVNTVYEEVSSMREALPIVWWKAICYHYVRRTRQVTRYRNGDAFTSTQVYYERVNSHTATSAFNFQACGMRDVSKSLINLENFPVTKIRLTKGFSLANMAAESDFEAQRSQFFQDHEQRDDYMETREGLDLLNVGFKDSMMAFADPQNLPWYVSHAVFWVASLLLFSWPLRVLIEHRTAYVHYHVHKLFGVNYAEGRLPRVDTLASSDMELNIRANTALVPSYSQALLMDVYCPNGERTQAANGSVTSASVLGGPAARTQPGYITLASYSQHDVTGQETAVTVNGYLPLNSSDNPPQEGASALFSLPFAHRPRRSSSGSFDNNPNKRLLPPGGVSNEHAHIYQNIQVLQQGFYLPCATGSSNLDNVPPRKKRRKLRAKRQTRWNSCSSVDTDVSGRSTRPTSQVSLDLPSSPESPSLSRSESEHAQMDHTLVISNPCARSIESVSLPAEMTSSTSGADAHASATAANASQASDLAQVTQPVTSSEVWMGRVSAVYTPSIASSSQTPSVIGSQESLIHNSPRHLASDKHKSKALIRMMETTL